MKFSSISKEQSYYYSIPRLLDAFDSNVVKRVACGHLHNIAITDHGEVFTWGWGINGALGHGNRKFRLKPARLHRLRGQQMVKVSASSTCTLAVTSGGSSTFAFDFKTFVNNPMYSDVKYKVQEKVIYGHRAVIFHRCEYLKQMAVMYHRFSVKSEEDEIEVPHIEYRVFVALLYYLYTDHLKVAPHLVDKLQILACKYKLPRLVSLCKQYTKITESVGPQEEGSSEAIIPSIYSHQMQEAIASPHFADVEFKLTDGTTVPAHKIILAARCDYFKTIFDSSFKESSQQMIKMLEIPQNTFAELLRYIYTNLTCIDPDQVVDVLLAADRFLIEDLKVRIEKDLEKERAIETIADLLLISDQASSPRLKKSCIEFIVQDFDSFRKSEGFKRLQQDAPVLLRHIDFMSTKRNKTKPGALFKKVEGASVPVTSS